MNLKTYWLGHDKKLHSASIGEIECVLDAINLTEKTLTETNEIYRKPILASVPCGKQFEISHKESNDSLA